MEIGEAIGNCQAVLRNGRLFEPRDETTHNSVHAAALEISSQTYLIGINDTLSEGQFQYLSGGNLTFSNWYPGTYVYNSYIGKTTLKFLLYLSQSDVYIFNSSIR